MLKILNVGKMITGALLGGLLGAVTVGLVGPNSGILESIVNSGKVSASQSAPKSADIATTYSKSAISSYKGFNQELQEMGLNISPKDLYPRVTKLADELTPVELEFVKSIRNKITVDKNTVFQKVIPEGDIEKYLRTENAYNTVRGCVTRVQDTKNLNTLEEVYDGLALNYDKSPFHPGSDATYGVIRFKTPQFEKAKIPYGPAMGEDDLSSPPFTGTGFTQSKNGEIIPEFKFYSNTKPEEGAEIYSVNSKTGEETLMAIYEDGKFNRVGGK